MALNILFDRVLSIGINYVGTRAELNGCINDVINLKNETKTKSHVIMTEVSRDKRLTPTRGNIITQINKFVTDVKPGEKLLFQYSGHGSYTHDANGDEVDRRDETICPLDYARAGDIKDDQLKKILVDPLPAGCQLWCIFDCCHSGTVVDLKYNYQVFQKPDSRRRDWVTKIDSHYQDTQCQVICFSGCMDHQTSADAYVERQFQGAMTWGILKTLKTLKRQRNKRRGLKHKKSTTQQTDTITYKELMKNLLRLMRSSHYAQIPQISAGHNLNLEDPLWSTSQASN